MRVRRIAPWAALAVGAFLIGFLSGCASAAGPLQVQQRVNEGVGATRREQDERTPSQQ